MSSNVRTRFAPSPTGHLHIGGARTALFAWLFARHHGGSFLLRVEYTDQARSTRASVEALIRDLDWLGLDWDEGPEPRPGTPEGPQRGSKGPYFQSQRLDIYRGYLEKLKAKGLAYPSFDSKEDVEAERAAAIAQGEAPVSAGHEAGAEELEEKARQGLKPAWRFRMPEGGVTEFEDLVHGRMRFENRLMADFVLVRSDGIPTYNFAATVDDALMEVSHVIRGDDHLSNTTRQVCLYRALDLKEPAFAHIPMILGPDKQRLSKRHGATAVGQYREKGFLPEALVNYLALLGWSFDDKQTIFGAGELVEKFGLERVGKHAAVFDNVKLEWMNGQYLKAASTERVADLAWPFFTAAGLVKEEEREARADWFRSLVASQKEKIRTLDLLPGETEFLFRDFESPQAEALARFFAKGDPGAWLKEYAAALEARAEFRAPGLEEFSRAFCQEKALKFGDFVAVARSALTGRTVSPGLFETMELLGRETCLRRMGAAAAWRKPA